MGLGCLIKGRSSSRAINNELSRSLPSMIIFDSYPSFIFFDSGSNPADDPTRGVELRSSSLEFPTWLQQLCDGDTRDFDAWVAQHGLGYQEMTGLPPFEELLGDAARSDQEDVLPSPAIFSTRGELSDFADQEPKDIAVPEPSSDQKGPLTKSTESIEAGASLGSAAEDPAPRECISPFELRRKDKLDCHPDKGYSFSSMDGPVSEDVRLRLFEIFSTFNKDQIFKDPKSSWPPATLVFSICTLESEEPLLLFLPSLEFGLSALTSSTGRIKTSMMKS